MGNKIRVLNDKVAIITGASGGIGSAIALELACNGCNIIINYLHNKNRALKHKAEIERQGVDSICFRADISKEKDVKNMVKKTIAHFGRLDILVNNAGVSLPKPFYKLDTKTWDNTFDVNLKGQFLCIRETAKFMKKSGKIINIASNIVQLNSKEYAHYTASKAGLISLTKSLAIELAPKIQVNCICPGFTETEMNQKVSRKIRNKFIAQTPLKKLCLPGDIAKAALFFASSNSDLITGQIIMVDGGRTVGASV